MTEKIQKALRLIIDGNRVDRARALTEIHLNRLLFNRGPVHVGTISYRDFLSQMTEEYSKLIELLKPGGEAEQAAQWASSRFANVARQPLPFPTFYNADLTLALLSHALTRYLRPQFVLEMGVGYGITSALILRALERNDCGELVSVDLPSLADPKGLYVGLAVPDDLRYRWTLYMGSSRQHLPRIISDGCKVGLFISDSANVYTIQRYEYRAVYPRLTDSGAALFNNIGSRFQNFLSSINDVKSYSIWQIDKPGCATGLIFKT